MNTPVPELIPAFFKVYIPANSSQRMGMLPNKAWLRDSHGNLWPVEVVKTGGDFFFENGWVTFIAENGVRSADLLVFRFDGDDAFDFKILGKTASQEDFVNAFSIIDKERLTSHIQVTEEKQKEIEIEEEDEDEDEDGNAVIDSCDEGDDQDSDYTDGYDEDEDDDDEGKDVEFENSN